MTKSHIIDGIFFEIPKTLEKIYNNFEPLSTKSVLEHLQIGDTFLDIGANFGYFSVLAARTVGPRGHVISIEASPDVLPSLARNLTEFSNTKIINAAAGKEKRVSDFFLTEDFVNSGVSKSPFQEATRKISVKMDSIDNLLSTHSEPIGEIQFIKCDVQGDEMAVLEGARRTIERSNQLKLIVEWAPAWMKQAGHDPADFPRFLNSLGFSSLIVLDDYLGKKMTINEMEKEFERDITGRRFCNVLASKS